MREPDVTITVEKETGEICVQSPQLPGPHFFPSLPMALRRARAILEKLQKQAKEAQ